MVCPQCGTNNENRSEACLRCKRSLHPSAMKGKIACFVHANREATTSCALCGSRLCAACAVADNSIDYCDGCAPPAATRHDYNDDYEKLPVLNPERVPVANFDLRFFAGLVDFGVVIVGVSLVVAALWLFTGGSLSFLTGASQEPVAFYLLRTLIVLSVPAYMFLPVALGGQTLGHKVCGVIVLQPDGHICTTRQAGLRALAQIVSSIPFFLGFAWMIWDRQKLTLFDRWSGTRVYEWAENS